MIKKVCFYATIFSIFLSFIEKSFNIEFYFLSLFSLYIYFDITKEPDKIECFLNLLDECMICYGENLKSVKLDNCEHYLCIDCYIELIDKSCPYCRQ